MTQSELSRMAGAVDDSTINIVHGIIIIIIIIIIILLCKLQLLQIARKALTRTQCSAMSFTTFTKPLMFTFRIRPNPTE